MKAATHKPERQAAPATAGEPQNQRVYLVRHTLWSGSRNIAVYATREAADAEAKRLEAAKTTNDGYAEYYVDALEVLGSAPTPPTPEGWETEDSDYFVVWGSHDEAVAREVFARFARELRLEPGDDDCPVPAFGHASEHWAHPAAMEVMDDAWPRSFVSDEPVEGWVPFLRIPWYDQ